MMTKISCRGREIQVPVGPDHCLVNQCVYLLRYSRPSIDDLRSRLRLDNGTAVNNDGDVCHKRHTPLGTTATDKITFTV